MWFQNSIHFPLQSKADSGILFCVFHQQSLGSYKTLKTLTRWIILKGYKGPKPNYFTACHQSTWMFLSLSQFLLVQLVENLFPRKYMCVNFQKLKKFLPITLIFLIVHKVPYSDIRQSRICGQRHIYTNISRRTWGEVKRIEPYSQPVISINLQVLLLLPP